MRALFLCCCCLIASSLSAQERTGDLRGRVVASGAGPIANAQVNVTGPALMGMRVTRSSSDGVFNLLALPPGRYTVRVAFIGYRPVVLQDVAVILGRTQGLEETRLEKIQNELSAVVVAAPRTTVDPVRTTVGATLDAEELSTLPADRDYKSLIATLPHVNTSYNGDPVNSAGASGLENMYFIDGVNVTSPFRGLGGTSLPYNFIQSVELRTGGYEAQYGRALGAIVNAVTYTGTNHFEGSVFGFFTNSALAAAPRSHAALTETGSASYDVGLRVGGPIVRDHLWYSAAYNPRVSRATREVGHFGKYPDRSRANIFAAKINWQARPATSVEVSVFGDPTTHHEVEGISFITNDNLLSPDSYLHLIQTGGTSYSLHATNTFASSSLLELALGYSSSRDNFLGDTQRGRTEGPYTDRVNNAVGGGVSYPNIISEWRPNASMRFTLPVRAHTAMAGIEYERAVTRRFLTNGGSGSVTRVKPDSFELAREEARGTFENRAPVAFLQDAWRISAQLTLSAGLRWSRQTLGSRQYGTGQIFPNEWQPRGGFNWLMDRDGRRRIFGSYGRFYQEQLLNLSSLYFVDYISSTAFYKTDPRVLGAKRDTLRAFTDYGSNHTNVPGASAERVDEITLGYEQRVGKNSLVTIRGIRRTLGTTFQQAIDPVKEEFLLGTPGKGKLTFLPRARRDYTALEVSSDGAIRAIRYRTSYVLSRVWGNFPGLFGSDLFFYPNPGVDYGLTIPFQAVNSTGYLPNDRTHVFKFSAAWSPFRSLKLGSFFTWQSGTPLNEFGEADDLICGGGCLPKFLVQRGTAGRTPNLADLNLRATYDASLFHTMHAQYVVDLLHLMNQQKPVRIDQQHYQGFTASGEQISPNPGFMKPLVYGPPFTARIGMEIKY